MTPEDRISEAVRALAEHFDVVQVFVQLHDSERDFTDAWVDGRGNTLARKSQVEDWLSDCTIMDNDDDDDGELTT